MPSATTALLALNGGESQKLVLAEMFKGSCFSFHYQWKGHLIFMYQNIFLMEGYKFSSQNHRVFNQEKGDVKEGKMPLDFLRRKKKKSCFWFQGCEKLSLVYVSVCQIGM